MKHGKSVAIVGVGGIFPKSPTLERFWANIIKNVNAAQRPPAGRWLLDPGQVYDATVGVSDKVYSEKACFVETPLDQLNLEGLDLPADLLAGLDPMFHLLLHAGRQAYLDGAVQPTDKSRVGVILGNLALPSERSSTLAREYLGATFVEQQFGDRLEPGSFETAPINRYVAGLPAGILARSLGLKGTSFTLDAACASSLYAIKLAVDELVAKRADAMLAGGLSRPDSLYTQMGFSQLRALSPSGTCAPFDAQGNGLVVGEGCGMFLLKRTEDAVRDGDRIYAVIRGVGLSNDMGGSLLAPASEGQLRAMQAAYRQAGWQPNDIDLIECHATGTPVGDAVEFRSLQSLWGEAGWQAGQCVIGSVKSNIGHLLTAAGSAALMKTVLALKAKTLPPTANFSRPSESITYAGSPFKVLAQPETWSARTSETPRRAAISAFGFGGINAHLLIEEWLPQKVAKSRVTFPPSFQRQNQPVAIVGMGAHVGPWETLADFQYRVLGSSQECSPTAPKRWWGAEQTRWFAEAGLNQIDFSGYFVDTVAAIPGAFRIPPTELAEMLPRQLLMLQVAGQALKDAGLKNEDLLFTGVFVGTGLDLNATNFSFRWSIENLAPFWATQLGLELTSEQLQAWVSQLREAAGPALSANRVMGALGSIVASRIAKEFRIGGPSFTLSNEENSGLRALEVGVRMLQEGSINRALVGAVDMAGDLRAVLARHVVAPYSMGGQARPFDKQADGGMIGEGSVAVVLKRLEDAQQDGDRVYAVIRGLGTATGGSHGQFAPDRETYSLALERTFRASEVSPTEVTYLETEGSAQPELDVMEANALGDFFGAEANTVPCYVGSAKADIGHLGAAAGLASLVKTALCLDRQILPPLRHVDAVRYEWIRGKRDFIVPTAPQYWLRNRAEGSRKAVVSGFAVDGSCSHVLLEAIEERSRQKPELLQQRPLGPRREGLFCLEADAPEGLLTEGARLKGMLAGFAGEALESLAALWLRDTGSHPEKATCVALVAPDRATLAELLQYLQTLLETPEELPPGLRDRMFYSPRPLGRNGQLAFIFPGSGNHFAGMGQDLSVQWPQIFRQQDRRSRYHARQFLPRHFWRQSLAESLHSDHNALVVGQVALGTAVSDLMRSFGIEPQAVSGYSLGESAGLFSLGAWTDRDGMAERLAESSLFVDDLAGMCRAAARTWGLSAKQPVNWALGLVDAPQQQVREALNGLERVYLLIVNTYDECVVGGDRDQLDQLVHRLGCHLLPLRGVTTVHCEVARQVADPYRALHFFPTTPPKGIRFYSTARGDSYPVTDDSAADVILEQAVGPIDYTRVIEKMYADGVRLFLEMGPGNSCSRMINAILDERPHLARAACYPGQDAVSLVLRMLGQCLAERVAVDLAALYPIDCVPAEAVPATKRIDTQIGGSAFGAVDLPAAGVTAPSAIAARKVPSLDAQPSSKLAANAAFEPLSTVAADPTIARFEQVSRQNLETHAAYLKFSEKIGQAIADNTALQVSLLEQMIATGMPLPETPSSPRSVSAPTSSPVPPVPEKSISIQRHRMKLHLPAPQFDRDMCMEFAIGSIAKMLGPEFAEVDHHPTRVRLPDEPLMLVDRIVLVEGEPRSMTHGRVVTEHDVTADRWYLDGGRIPTCVAVEAGQADLFLSGYLGIDFVTKGKAVYRLLDAVVTFHRSLPVPGDVIRYDIKIDHFFRQDQTYLFRFSFEATVNGEPLLSMQNGCAGFFTAEELAAGQGIVHTKLDLQPMPGRLPDDWRELTPMVVESYDEAQVDALYQGDLEACFGAAFAGLPLQRPYTLPGGKLKLVDRVVELDPQGGRYSLGQIRAEMDIHPDDWFLTCHFCDDNVMPGTLMYECCMHTLRIFLLRMGWVGDEGATWCEPIPGVDSGLKCRGQVIDTTKTVTYQVSIKELGYGPEPFAIVDALMFADGKPIVEIPNMSVRLAGLDRQKMETLWSGTASVSKETVPSTVSSQGEGGQPPFGDSPLTAPLYDYGKILAFSTGNPSEAFGAPYKVFDRERRIARLPRPPFQFLDRIVAVTGEPFVLVEGATCLAEYDVPADAWYFGAERSQQMPFSVLLETGLQPCGWLAAYLGSALTSDIDLKFRNLDGNAVQHRPVTPASGTLTTKATITRVAASGGMIIQNYDFEISDRQGLVYSGDTVFGFFSAESLAQQVGVRDVTPYQPEDSEIERGEMFDYPTESPFPEKQLRMIDRVDLFVKDGGPHGLGFVRGSKQVDPGEWFFEAHFYQDPVCPGSLGLESFLQLLKLVAVKRWGVHEDCQFECIALGEQHRWNYRGQIIPSNDKVTVEALVTAVDDDARLLRADGSLAVDGRVIYRMQDFTLRIAAF